MTPSFSSSSDVECFTRNANVTKFLVIRQLKIDGIISANVAKQLHRKYVAVVYRKGMFGSLIDRFLNLEDADNWYTRIVKL